MNTKTIMAYTFWDRHDVEGSEHMKWTNNIVENIEPTGRWRFRVKDGSKDLMQIEMVYTQCTRGTVSKYKTKQFKYFKFFEYLEEYDVKETMKDIGRIAWINESDIKFSTTHTYECTNMGKY